MVHGVPAAGTYLGPTIRNRLTYPTIASGGPVPRLHPAVTHTFDFGVAVTDEGGGSGCRQAMVLG